MPNICTNRLTIATDTPQGAAARPMLLDATRRDGDEFLVDFDKIVPEPQGLLLSDARKQWRLARWGSKWIGLDCEIPRDEPGLLVIVFETAWAPPDPLLQAIADRTGAALVNNWTVEGEWTSFYRTTFQPCAEPVEESWGVDPEDLAPPVATRSVLPRVAADMPF